MNKEQFKKEQPIVYQILSNALKYNHLAHAYLFTGEKGNIKQDVALLFAQSLVCQHVDEDGFACQNCDVCKRMEKEESYDFHYIHGKENRIKKSDIVQLQEFFTSTSQEVSNRRIYILDGFDLATKDAANSLLKFLEEPGKEIYAILIADEKSNLLPTIQSRCQNIVFRPVSKKEIEQCFSQHVDEDCAKMLALNGYSEKQVLDLIEKEEFHLMKEYAIEYISKWDSFEEICHMQMDCFVPKSKKMDKQWIRLWIQWMLYLIKKEKLELSKYAQIQRILIEAMDALRAPVDVALLMDQMYYRIRKVVSE